MLVDINTDGLNIEEETGVRKLFNGLRSHHVAHERAQSVLNSMKIALENEEESKVLNIQNFVKHRLNLTEHHLDLDRLNGQIIVIQTSTNETIAYLIKIDPQSYETQLKRVNPNKRGMKFISGKGFK